MILAPTDRTRAMAVEVAKDLLDALAIRRFDRLKSLLADQVWVLWPTGVLSKHARDPLIEELGTRQGERARIQITSPRSYSFKELRVVLARGLADALDVILELDKGIAVTAAISGGRGPAGRVLISTAGDKHQGWRATSLVLGGPDDAHLASLRFEDPPAPELKIAAQVVRNLILGHGILLRTLGHYFTPQIWIGDQLVPPEALFQLADDGPARIGSGEAVFLGTKEVDLKTLSKLVGLAFNKIRDGALDNFGAPFDKLSPRLSATSLGLFDPANGRVTPGGQTHCLIVRTPQPRIAGVFL